MRAKRRNVCQTCRSRKLGCDGKQPACSQCILRQIPCSGYRQEFLFVPQVSFEIENQVETKHESEETIGSQKKPLVNSNGDLVQPIRSSRPAAPTRRDTQLETKSSELEDDVQSIVQHYAPINSNAPAESNSHHNQICGAWVEVLPSVSVGIRKTNFLWSAIKTLATVIRHHESGNKLCQPQILKMYGDSLGLMRKALEEARDASYIEHSTAIMCLAVTDIMLPTFESGWMMHIQGVGNLAERLGPETFSSGIMHTIFMGFRPLLLISSILQREKTFLAREEWTTIPFRGQPGSVMQLLLNKASKLPALLESYNEIAEHKEVSNTVAIDRLRGSFQNLLKSFQEWELMLHSEAISPVFWSRPDPENLLSPDVEALWFPNIMIANSLNHCWAFEIIVTKHLSMLGGAISTAKGYCQQAPLCTLSSSPSEKSIAAVAEMICASMPYLMQPEMKLYGPGSAFFTFPTAIQVFQSEPDYYSVQLSRCRRILDRLASIGFHFPRT